MTDQQIKTQLSDQRWIQNGRLWTGEQIIQNAPLHIKKAARRVLMNSHIGSIYFPGRYRRVR